MSRAERRLRIAKITEMTRLLVAHVNYLPAMDREIAKLSIREALAAQPEDGV